MRRFLRLRRSGLDAVEPLYFVTARVPQRSVQSDDSNSTENPERFEIDLALGMPRSGAVASSLQLISFMSQHRSLKGVSTISAKRNVLKRFERIELLKKRGQFKDGDRAIGLKKTMPEA